MERHVTPPPGPRSRALSGLLRDLEAPGVNTLPGCDPAAASVLWEEACGANVRDVDGNIYNYFAVEYEYPNGMRMQSMCRQVADTDGNFPGIGGVSEALVGTKGTSYTQDGRSPNSYLINGQPAVARACR